MVSWFGTAMAPIAMAFGVLQLTGSARDTGVVVASQTGAQIVALLFGGVVADRVPRRRVMVAADLLAMISQCAIAFAFIDGRASVPLLAGLMALNGIALAFHSPALTGFIPEVVKAERLQPANALLGTARSGAVALGATVAGMLVATFGAGVAVAVNALTFAVSAMLVIRIRPRTRHQRAPATVFKDLREGFSEFISHRWLWVIVLQFSLVVAAGQSVYGLIGPAVARTSLGGAVDWGFIAAAFGIGTLAGAFVALRIDVDRPMLVATNCVLVFAAPAMLLATSTTVWVIALGTFAHGVAGQLFGVLWVTTLHRKIPAAVLSRVSAYDNFGSIALAPLGLIAAGVLLESVGAQFTLWTAAAVIILPTLLALCDRDVRTLRFS